jgi:hypothetical protein
MNLRVISVILRNLYYFELVFGDTHTHTPKFILEQGGIPKFCPLPLPFTLSLELLRFLLRLF